MKRNKENDKGEKKEGVLLRKKLFAGILFIIFAVSLAGCTKKDDTAAKKTEEKTTAQAEEKSFTAGYVYAPDKLAEKLEKQRVKMENLNEKTILAALKDAEVLSKDVEILAYEKKKQKITIDFNEAFGLYFKTMGTAEESLKMEAVAKTFCENLGASKFAFTVEGEILETGHQIYDQTIGVK